MENSFCSTSFLFLGVHPDKSRKIWMYILNVSITTCMMVLGSLEYYHNGQLDAVVTISGLLGITVKYTTLFFGSKTITQILEAREQFWTLDFTDDGLTFFISNYKRVNITYRISFTLTVTLFAVMPFVVKGSSIFNCYVLPEVPYPLYYLIELYLLTLASSTFMSFNVFVCCLITSVVVQFRYLNLKLAALKFENVEDDKDLSKLMRDLRSLIKYQQFLIRYVEDLNKFLSVPVALLMCTNVINACLFIYVMTTNKSLSDGGKTMSVVFIIVIEFFMAYGLPGQSLIDESRATADMIYYQCKWYLPKLRPLRKDLLVMILRNQKGVCIRAGNYHVVSNQTIVLILRTIYTFYTFLQNVT